ncbi:MAG: DUF305 domain-containing protein [Gemmatimonadales bacterium]
MFRARSSTFIAAVVAVAVPALPVAARAQALPSAEEMARVDSLRRPYTQVDIDFMTGMIYHHAQAVVMANWAPTHGASKDVGILCSRIARGQTAEIGLMQNWLKARGQPVPEPDPNGMSMGGMKMLMPGMLTPAQMQKLDASRGAAFDRYFLVFMIQHHKGALTMVDTLFSHRGSGVDEVVFKFATAVHVDQMTEINRMEGMLNAMYAAEDDQ